MTLVTVQLSRQESLNGICDIAKAIEYEWNRAGLELPRRNTLSNANMKRDPKMAENVFWKLLEHFKAISPAFASSRFDGFLARMKNHNIFLLDSSTIQLTLDCFDWARHRRQKAAAHHDSKCASACTEQLVQGDILVADRAYLDFSFLNGLASRDAFFVVRKKTNTQFKVVESLKSFRAPDPKKQSTQILADEKQQDINRLYRKRRDAAHGQGLRQGTRRDERDGVSDKQLLMVRKDYRRTLPGAMGN